MRSPARFCINTLSASSRHLQEKGQIVWLSERSALLHLRTPLAKFRTKKKKKALPSSKQGMLQNSSRKEKSSKQEPPQEVLHAPGWVFVQKKKVGTFLGNAKCPLATLGHLPCSIFSPLAAAATCLPSPPCLLLSSPLLQSCFHSLKVRTKGYPAHAKDRQQGQLCVLLSWRKPRFP